jgi:hypothetical protein
MNASSTSSNKQYAHITKSDKANNVKSLVTVHVRISFPTNHGIAYFVAYPYPMRPPKSRKAQNPLPIYPKELKTRLLDYGYTNRTMPERPYPNYGYRWMFAFRAALAKSGLLVPHSMFEYYQWRSAMLPYMKAECERINAIEDNRSELYRRASTEYDESRADYEAEAQSRGLYPTEVRFLQQNILTFAQAKLAPGTWWIVGTLKIPSLTYYWQIPVSVTGSEPQFLDLNENNALLIDGAW